MCLKKTKSIIFVFVIFFFNNQVNSEEIKIEQIINHLQQLKNFSVSFLQSTDNEISEGKISVKNKRIRIDYKKPTKILIILSKDKAMYYNHDLDEDEFFDPKDTSAWFFFEIFNNRNFFLNSNYSEKDNNIIIEKIGVVDEQKYNLKLFFEKNPIILRKIRLNLDQQIITLSVFGHNYNEKFDDNYFKLINPSFYD